MQRSSTHLAGEQLDDEGGHGRHDTEEHVQTGQPDEGRAGHFEDEAGRVHHRGHREPEEE